MVQEVLTAEKVDSDAALLKGFAEIFAKVLSADVEAADEKTGGQILDFTLRGFVFLSGPYKDIKTRTRDWTAYADIDVNINEARRWAAQMATEGIPYFCPHLNSAHMEVIVPGVPEAFWLQMDLEILDHAAAIFLLPNWRESQGARAEMEYAQVAGIPIYTHNMFERFVDDWRSGRIHSVQGKEEEDAVHQSDSQEPPLGTKPNSDNGGGVELRADWSDTQLA